MMEEDTKLKPRADRKDIKTKVEFIIDCDIANARADNISETGMRFITEKPIKFRMRMNVEGKKQEYAAYLVWAKKDFEGTTSYGFQFIADKDECNF
jgi:hypothetical protein